MNAETENFAQFIVAREQALRRTGWLLTGDWGLAEDLVQTALARVWPRWERIRRRDNPEIYVRQVMINTLEDLDPAHGQVGPPRRLPIWSPEGGWPWPSASRRVCPAAEPMSWEGSWRRCRLQS